MADRSKIINTHIGIKIKELRKENNLSRAKLADKLQVSVRLISYWENGQRECDFNMLIKIADIFLVSTDFLLGKTDF